MTKDHDIRELRTGGAEILMTAQDTLGTIKGDEGMATHGRSIRWLMPQAREVFDRLRKGEIVTRESQQFAPVHTLLIVIDHIELLVANVIDHMDDEEYAKI